MKRSVFRNRLTLKGLSFTGPAKILLSKLIHHRLFHQGAQRLWALLLQTCRCLLKTLIERLLLLKTLKTQSSRIGQGKGRLLPVVKTLMERVLLLKTLKTKRYRTAW
jgi:hypothetical protein